MGKDPHEIRQGFKGELILGEQLKDSYKTILTSSRYLESIITTIKPLSVIRVLTVMSLIKTADDKIRNYSSNFLRTSRSCMNTIIKV